MLYSCSQATTAGRAWSWVANLFRDNNSNSSVEWNDSLTALSSADPVRPIDWVIPAPAHTFVSCPPVNSPPWSELNRIRVSSDYAEPCVMPRIVGIACAGRAA